MIFFTSDHHFGHQNVIAYCSRPFATTDEMNEYMVKVWNETVRPEDIVYYVGDFSLSKTMMQLYLPRLNGLKKYLVAGNHDHCHPVHYKKEAKGERMRELYTASGFDDIWLDLGFQFVTGPRFRVCHFPYGGDDPKNERTYLDQYRPKDNGEWLIHGHVHEKWKVRDRQINVGVDVWNFRPVSIDDIVEIVNQSRS